MLLTMALTSVVLEAARLDRPRDPARRPVEERAPFRLAYVPAIAPAIAPGAEAGTDTFLSFRSTVTPAPAAPARLFGGLLVEE